MQCYSFKRRLNDEEWAVLRGYTRRIWHILGHSNSHGWLDSDTLIMICNTSVAYPLFPNLRTFYWQGTTMIPAVHISVPSLTTLTLHLTHGHVPALKDFLDTVGDLCPNISRVRIRIHRPHNLSELSETICRHIQRLMKLRVLDSRGVTLDTDMILRLSEILSLKHLSFSLNPDAPVDWITSSSSAPMFQNLAYLGVASQSLESVTGLLSCIRLPVVENLDADFTANPSKETFRSYITTVRNICSPDSLAKFRIHGIRNPETPDIRSSHRLTLDDVRPCMAFVNIRSIHINLPRWSIELTDSDLLELVSAWPHIHTLCINDEWGWRTTGGITLHGLSQLLYTRRSLSYLCIAIDTESYSDLPPKPYTCFLPLPNPLTINLVDSLIRKAEDVPRLADAFWKLGLHPCCFLAWDGMEMEDQEDDMVYHHQKHEWSRVFDGVDQGPPREQYLEVESA